MGVVRAGRLGLVGMLMSATVVAAQQPPAGGQQPQPSAQQPPTTPQQPGGQQGVPPAAAPAPPTTPRTFSAPAGLIFNTVRADRVADFEKAMGYLEVALAKSTNETVREQAKGWRIFKATEPGPSGTVLYVFLIDPAVAGAEYGLGRILAEAYPDQAQLQEIWKLYTSSVTGGSLLNLTPVQAPAPKPALK